MEIEIDGKDLYEQIKTAKQFLEEGREESETDASGDTTSSLEEKMVKNESDIQDTDISIPIYNTRIPLPFGSIGGRIFLLDNHYRTTLEINPPEKLDLDRSVLEYTEGRERGELTEEGIRRLNDIESCLYLLPDLIQERFGSRYVRLGENFAGYFLDGKGNPHTSISRSSESGTIFIHKGGSGLNRLILGEEKGFIAEMYVLSEDLTKIVNAGIDIARDLELLRGPNPDITLRLGSIA